MKRSLLIIGVAFAVTIGIIFSIRASTDAMAVILGVVLGVFAGVPTTFLVTYMLTRSCDAPNGQLPHLAHQPPVVVINAAEKANVSQPAGLPTLSSPSHGRTWTIVGDAETE